MRTLAAAVVLSFAVPSAGAAQTAMPDSEGGRYTFSRTADGTLRLDTRTGQVSTCSRGDAGWTCRTVPDERAALEGEIARLQGENATLKRELMARGLPVPGVPGTPAPRSGEPDLKLPSDAEVDKVMSFLEKVWRRLIDMVQSVQKDMDKKG